MSNAQQTCYILNLDKSLDERRLKIFELRHKEIQ